MTIRLEKPTKAVSIPLGAILPWDKSLYPVLPTGYLECDGSTIVGGPMNGLVLPDINSGRFLKGALSDDTLEGTDQHSHTVTFNEHSAFHSSYSSRAIPDATVMTSNTKTTYPPYYNIVWIMKVN